MHRRLGLWHLERLGWILNDLKRECGLPRRCGALHQLSILMLNELRGSGLMHQAGVMRRELRDRRPVECIAFASEQAEKAVVEQARQWHRYAKALRGGKSEPDVLFA